MGSEAYTCIKMDTKVKANIKVVILIVHDIADKNIWNHKMNRPMFHLLLKDNLSKKKTKERSSKQLLSCFTEDRQVWNDPRVSNDDRMFIFWWTNPLRGAENACRKLMNRRQWWASKTCPGITMAYAALFNPIIQQLIKMCLLDEAEMIH